MQWCDQKEMKTFDYLIIMGISLLFFWQFPLKNKYILQSLLVMYPSLLFGELSFLGAEQSFIISKNEPDFE